MTGIIKYLKYILLGAAISFAIYSCTKDQAEPKVTVQGYCDTLNYTYTNDIKLIIDTYCTSSCHTSTKSSGFGSANLETYTSVKDEVDNGTFECAINQNSGCTPMPLGGNKIADSLLTKVNCWIENNTPQ